MPQFYTVYTREEVIVWNHTMTAWMRWSHSFPTEEIFEAVGNIHENKEYLWLLFNTNPKNNHIWWK